MGSFLHREKVLIIGSGISGLTLAQILRKAEIEFELFERDGETRAQGWSIGLDKYVQHPKINLRAVNDSTQMPTVS